MCQLKLAIDTFSASTLNYYVNVDFNWTKNQNKKKIKHHQAFFKSHCNSCISLSKVFFLLLLNIPTLSWKSQPYISEVTKWMKQSYFFSMLKIFQKVSCLVAFVMMVRLFLTPSKKCELQSTLSLWHHPWFTVFN